MILITLIVICIAIGFFFKKSIVVYILQILCCIVIIGFNTDNPDYNNYLYGFNHAAPPEHFNIFEVLDIGFRYIQLFCKDLGIYQYEIFRIILTAILFTIFGITFSKRCKYRNMFLSLYIIFFIAIDNIQIRNFASFVTLLPFIFYYIQNQNKNGVLIFTCGLILAFTIHFSAIFYSVFYLLIIKNRTLRYLLGILVVIVVSEISFSTSNLAIIERTSNYSRPTTLGAIACCFLLVCNWIYINWIRLKYRQFVYSNDNIYNNITLKNNLDTLVTMNLLLLLLIPSIFINATSLRLWRFISLINVAYILNVLYYSHQYNNKQPRIIFSLLAYCILITLWFNEEGVYPCLLNNSFL